MTTVTQAITGRISTRAYRADPLPEALVREILDVARWSPSGGNVQPWKVVVVSGVEREVLVSLAMERLAANPRGEEGDRPIYPADLWEPYRSRRYNVGEDMYKKLGIGRDDKPARFTRVARNYDFFDAPVAMFFVIDERMGHGQWAHLGMFMQTIALAAYERGVATCMQEAWARLRVSLKQHFALDEHDMVYCAMALGYADETAAINTLRSDRAEVDEIATFVGF